MREWLAKLKTKTGGKLAETVSIILLIAVAALILFTSLGGKEGEEPEGGYARQTEKRLAAVLSQIEGAGEVEVFLTVRSEGALVVATETTEHADGSVTTSPVLSGGEPIVLEECLPAVTGVLIVAEGADDLSVRFNLLEAAASVLDINQSLIKVYTKGGSQLL